MYNFDSPKWDRPTLVFKLEFQSLFQNADTLSKKTNGKNLKS